MVWSPEGVPLRSWCVELLPFLGPEEQALWEEWDKDRPWHQGKNVQLARRMPRVFAAPGAAAGTDQTPYKIFTGPDAPFSEKRRDPGQPPVRGPRLTDISDGAANTILIIEGRHTSNWAGPCDLVLLKDSDGYNTNLLGLPGHSSINLVTFDGVAHSLKHDIHPKTLQALITPRGGEALGPDWPGGR
jgi:hypothetical protein